MLIASGKNVNNEPATGKDIADMTRHQAELITNGGRAPIPTRVLNQRQKRKVARQTGRY